MFCTFTSVLLSVLERATAELGIKQINFGKVHFFDLAQKTLSFSNFPLHLHSIFQYECFACTLIHFGNLFR
ncbi:hypothetical protein BC827DRAFT_657966 [Russula dissimulans]|nr:hypothetical protein BC827DRAFT_657966 [Russula dissimulans]